MPKPNLLKFGSVGTDVRWLQQRLIKSGWSVPLSCVFDATLDAALREFQASHIGKDGQALAVDGEVIARGDATWWALAHPSGVDQEGIDDLQRERARQLARRAPAGERRAVLLAAAGEVGTRERPDGSNGGPRVDVYTEHWRVPWCALFVSWCLRQARGGGKPAFPPHPALASVWKIARWAFERGVLRLEPARRGELPEAVDAGAPVGDPAPGDAFLMLSTGAPGVDVGHGHTGFVLRVEPEHVVTIEGNCGNAVRCRRRARDTITAYVVVAAWSLAK